MLDGSLFPPVQRSRGQVSASFADRRGTTRPTDLHQSGSARILLPRTNLTTPEVVFLNTSGGLTSGDRLDLTLTLGDHTRLLATTQTAEHAYHAPDGPAQVTITAHVGAGSRLDWMPQETILYQSSNLIRRTDINLAADARCLLAETVIPGRHAMGKVVTNATLLDHRLIRRAGRPVWAESLYLTPETLAADGPALLNGARALAVVCFVAQGPRMPSPPCAPPFPTLPFPAGTANALSA